MTTRSAEPRLPHGLTGGLPFPPHRVDLPSPWLYLIIRGYDVTIEQLQLVARRDLGVRFVYFQSLNKYYEQGMSQ